MNWRILTVLLLALLAACKKAPEPRKQVPLPTFRHEMKGLAVDSTRLAGDSLLFVFYKMNNFQTVWYREQNRRLIQAHLTQARCDGLIPEDYNTNQLLELERRFEKLTQRELVDYDILLTTMACKYLTHLSQGKINPREFYDNWDLPPNPMDINALLSGGISGDSLPNVIKNAKPPHDHYARLERALEILESFPRDQMRKIPSLSTKLRLNDTSKTVIMVKKRLMYWNDMPYQDSISPVYDENAVQAIKRFQSRHGLAVDGVIGKGTLEALNFSREQRRQQIVANMERWRWFPRKFSNHYVVINIPGFEMTLVKDGDTIQTNRVVVGKNDRKTAVLVSRFSRVILNPTWTVPPTIVREDLTPDARRDRSYFASRHIAIYNWRGEIVSPADWNPDKAKSYRYVQRPGPDNALGTVKFDYPNRFTVYLHDTNHRELFSRSNRSLSSGCIRVEDPLPLAAYLINNEKIDLDSITRVIETQKTTPHPVRDPIHIYQLYWTAWSDNGKLIFRDDIYQLDAPLYEALRNRR